jgi:nitroreductase
MIFKIKTQIKKIPFLLPFFNYAYIGIFKPLGIINLGFYTTIRTLRFSLKKNNIEAWKVSMRVSCHIIEKGLTMPERRLGFGLPRLANIANEVLKNKHNENLSEVKVAVGIIKDYKKVHEKSFYKLPKKISDLLERVEIMYPDLKIIKQLKLNKEQYFSSKNENFLKFSTSRRSIRNFSGKANAEQVQKAVELALKAPSACNRQVVKCHLFNDKEKVQEILSYQNGNRGFGHLIPQLCVLTVDLRLIGENEQNDIYFNAGLFAMNLCYSFHYYEIASCMLNWAAPPKRDKKLRKILNIPNHESITVLIGFGIPSDEINIARSDKKSSKETILNN